MVVARKMMMIKIENYAIFFFFNLVLMICINYLIFQFAVRSSRSAFKLSVVAFIDESDLNRENYKTAMTRAEVDDD